MRCAMTGMPVSGSTDAIWADGEWISWDWINQQMDGDKAALYPGTEQQEHIVGEVVSEGLETVFENLVDTAADYKELTGRYLQIWGELGEVYAEVKWCIKRHCAHAQGSDGRLGNDWVEVKTISPEKGSDVVQVKRAGNFNKLLIVRISENFEFEARLIDRKLLAKGSGTHARISWNRASAPIE